MPIALWDSKAVGELREYSSLLPIRISECAEKLAEKDTLRDPPRVTSKDVMDCSKSMLRGLSQFMREREL